ncbi:hypothetical protein [Pectinatus frisingensis]|uniref:hypothetical protein n=1 Tax=Pectinatus frisingensis TaxID=865 RepID=UPI0015F5A92A|nr:hypothetical protein [Pectinatus frisingensis]
MSKKYIVINTDGTNAFYNSDVHDNIPNGALEISNTDYQTFFSNSGKYYFININNTAILSKITYSADEIRQQKIDTLNAEYQPQFNDLAQSLGLAMLSNDTAAQDSIKTDYTALKTEYTNKKGIIENGNS